MATYDNKRAGNMYIPSDSGQTSPAAEKRSKRFTGTTSIDIDHSHHYQVDIDGNGMAWETSHPRQSKIKHSHEIVNWGIQSAESSCYPNCEELYGIAGASPHIHSSIKKSILKKQVNRYSKFLPAVDIDRIILEPSRGSSLSSTVEFCIKQEGNSINTWISDPNLRKNLKIKIIQSTSHGITEKLSEDITINFASEPRVREISGITIDDVIGGQNNSSNLHFKRTFGIDVETPQHLSYFIFVYLETKDGEEQNGYVMLQKVIDKGKSISEVVQDFRHFENIKKNPIDLGYTENQAPKQSKVPFFAEKDVVVSRKKAYFSEMFLSRDRLNRAKFAFGVDFRKIIRDSSIFGNLYENINRTKSQELLNLSSIQYFALKRRRINDVMTNNKLGSQRGGQSLFEKESIPEETLLETGDTESKGLIKASNSNAGIRELNLLLNNGEGVRFFTGYDESVSSLSDGIYQYGVEVTIEDKTKEYLEMLANDLSAEKRKLYEYYTDANDNYIFTSNRFTQDFIDDQNKKPENWKAPVTKYLNVASVVNSINIDRVEAEFFKMVSPEKATPKSIMALINIMDDLVARLGSIVDFHSSSRGKSDKNREAKSYTSAGLNKMTTYEHWFTNDQINASLANNVGYDYLSNTESASRSTNISGLRAITIKNYSNRVSSEFKKYFENKRTKDDKISLSYLSPSFGYFKSSESGKIFNFIKSDDNTEHANLAANILAFNTSKQSKGLTSATDEFKDVMSGFYSNMNLTVKSLDGGDIVKPLEPTGVEYTDPDIDPSELYMSLMKSFSKSGASNDDSIKNPFAEKSTSFKVGDKQVTPDEDFVKMWEANTINYIANRIESVRSVLSPPPVQLKALMDGQNNIEIGSPNVKDKWDSESLKDPNMLPYFNFRYLMVNKIEVLTGFSSRGHNTRIKDLTWAPLNKSNMNMGIVICRMKSFELPIMGIKYPKGLKLPVYDNYFILVAGV